MRIAISSTGESLDSQMDPRFGRASLFLVYDTDTKEEKVVSNNDSVNMAHGAGIHAAENVARQEVQYVLTGQCGPKAFRTLQAAGIKIITGMSGTVRDVVEKFEAGGLTSADSPDM